MTVKELRDAAVQAAEEARNIKDKVDAEGRTMNEEEADEFTKHLRESKRLEQEADRQQELEEAEARLNKPKEPQVKQTVATGDRVSISTPNLFRFGKLRAFKGKDAEVNAYRSGKWIMATLLGNAAARQWCRDHGIELRVQTEGINAAGGFVVPDVMERAIIDLREEYGNARQECRILPMSSDHTVIPRRSGGVTAYFIGETDEITASDKSWNQVELTAKKLGALTRMSTDLSEDAIISIADDLAREMSIAFSTKEDQCAIDGDGTSTYGGMTGIRVKMIDGSHAGSYVEAAAAGDEWSEIDSTDLVNVMGALPKYARAGAKWHCSPIAKVAVFDRLLMAAGGNTNRNLAEGQPAQYAGYPIVEWPAMPTDDTSAALNAKIMLFFGNMNLSSTFGDRRGITVKVSDQRYLEYDQIGIQATERFCVNHHDIGGASGVRGPVVGLLGNT